MTKKKTAGAGKAKAIEDPGKAQAQKPTQSVEKPAENTKPPVPEDEKPKEPTAPTKPPILPEEDEKQGKKSKEDKKRIDRAREVFETHSVDKLYFTTDGTCFLNGQHALMHAGSIKSETVITVTREECK